MEIIKTAIDGVAIIEPRIFDGLPLGLRILAACLCKNLLGLYVSDRISASLVEELLFTQRTNGYNSHNN